MKELNWRFWVLASLGLFLMGAADDPPVRVLDPLSLAWCLERAEAANPDIAVDTATAEAARRRVVPAGALDDPRITYEASNVPRDDVDFDSTPMSGHQLRLAQKFPFPGLLNSREEAAREAAHAASARLEDRRRRVAGAVEQAWAELGFAQRALVITDRNIELLRQLTRTAEAKYRVGSGRQQDVLRAQVELTTLLQERLRRVDAIRKAEAALAALLDLPGGSRLPRTTELAEKTPLPEPTQLFERLEEVNPRLRALAAEVEEARRLRRVAALEGYPDFDLGIGYRIRENAPGDPVRGDDFLLASVTVRLPLNRAKWRERVAEREALVRRAKAAHRAERARLQESLQREWAELERADSEVELLGTGLVPQARQSLESSRSGYEVDKVDFLSLIDSQVSLLEAELRLVRAAADRRTAFAAIEAAFGERIR